LTVPQIFEITAFVNILRLPTNLLGQVRRALFIPPHLPHVKLLFSSPTQRARTRQSYVHSHAHHSRSPSVPPLFYRR
jgi:hypothetical protein